MMQDEKNEEEENARNLQIKQKPYSSRIPLKTITQEEDVESQVSRARKSEVLKE
jgi:hypothetical protein